MTPDNELLRRYARTRSEDAFAELVRRYVNLVYSAALRQVGSDAHLAQDVAQTVFTDLARKAGSLAQRESLTGWLYTSAHFAAAKIARTESRRRGREEKFMREPVAEPVPEADWEKIRPALDDAMHELKESDREAILFRYFENQPFVQVGAKLGLNENAARMRVERALEKLRAIFTKRGITTAAAALASVISANAVQTAPAGLATTLTTTSIAAVGTGTAFTLLKFMTSTHIKLGLSALLAAGATTAMVVQHQTQTQLRSNNKSLRQQIARLKSDNESLSNRLASVGEAKSLTDEQYNELLRLRGEVGVLHREVAGLGKLRQKGQQLQTVIGSAKQQQKTMLQRLSDAQYEAIALIMFADDNHGQYPTNFLETSRYLRNGRFITHQMETNFDLVYRGRRISITNGAFATIVLKEKRAHEMLDGQWVKIYGFADGHSGAHTESSDDFNDYEREHIISSPSGQ